MKALKWTGLLVATLAMACNAATTGSESIPELGVARLVVTDTAYETTVRGLDDHDAVIATMTLVHGQFELTGPFVEEYDTPVVDGRKLDVDVLGEKLSWQTAGYTPTLHMPPHPPSAQGLYLFLNAPEVKTVLDRWQIGWRPYGSADEAAYTTGSFGGTNVFSCDGQTTCGSARGLTINTCGNSAAALSASQATQSNPVVPGTNQIKLAQCCPSGSGGQSTQWFATKTCPLSGTTSECGTGTGACKGCAVYDARVSCSVTHTSTTVSYDYSATIPNCGTPCGPIYAEGEPCGGFCAGVCKGGFCQLVPSDGF